MSESPIISDDRDIEDLDDQELLERIATMDPSAYPIATKAQNALDRLEQMDEIQDEDEGGSS